MNSLATGRKGILAKRLLMDVSAESKRSLNSCLRLSSLTSGFLPQNGALNVETRSLCRLVRELMSANAGILKTETSIQQETCSRSKTLYYQRTTSYRRNIGKSRSWSSRPLLIVLVVLWASLDKEVRRSRPSGCDRVHFISCRFMATAEDGCLFSAREP